MRDPHGWNWFRIQIDDEQVQHIALEACERRFGGRQWYFIARGPARELQCYGCLLAPNRLPAASDGGGRSPIIHSSSPGSTGHILGRAGSIVGSARLGSFDPSEWEFPPKPKWMRWPTYHRAENKFDRYEAALDMGTFELVAKFLADT